MRGLAFAGLAAALLGSGPVAATAQSATVEPVVAAAPAAAGTRGPVTNLPLPRYVTLKTNEGYARRGPGLSHRIDWVFTRTGMPLKVTAEFEHWRRVEDADGAGGWVHYALLSGSRAVLVTGDMTEMRAGPDMAAAPVLLAEYGVIARLLECNSDWCRVIVDGSRVWARKSALWGVDPEETLE